MNRSSCNTSSRRGRAGALASAPVARRGVVINACGAASSRSSRPVPACSHSVAAVDLARRARLRPALLHAAELDDFPTEPASECGALTYCTRVS